MNECCATCRHRKKLVKYDYSHGGCIHTDMEGYACMSFVDEDEIEWMVGLSDDDEMCECYKPKEVKRNE